MPKQFSSCETIKNLLLDFPNEQECLIDWMFSSLFPKEKTEENIQLVINQLEADYKITSSADQLTNLIKLCESFNLDADPVKKELANAWIKPTEAELVKKQIILTEAIKLGEHLCLNVDLLIENLADILIESPNFDLVKEIGVPINCLVKLVRFMDLDILFDSFAQVFYPGESKNEIVEKLCKMSGDKNFLFMNHYRTLIVNDVSTRLKVLTTHHRNNIKEWVISRSKDSILYLDPHGRVNINTSEAHVCLNSYFPDRYRKIFEVGLYYILEKTDGSILYCSLSGKLNDINLEDDLNLELVATNQNLECLLLFSDKDGANVFYSMKGDKVKKLICPDYLKKVYIKDIAFSWNAFMITYIEENSIDIDRVGVLIRGQILDDDATIFVRYCDLDPNLVLKKEIHYLKNISYVLTETGQLFSVEGYSETIIPYNCGFVTDISDSGKNLVIITL